MRSALVLLIASIGSLATASAASATFPGANGPIVFSQPIEPGVYSLDPASGRRALIARSSTGYAAVSADGQTVAFDRSGPYPELASLWISGIDGSDARQVASGFSGIADVALSPDAQTIVVSGVYESPGVFPAGIFAVGVDDGEVQLLSGSVASIDKHPEFAPGGGRIVFDREVASNCDRVTTDVWLMNADGSGQRPLADSPRQGESEPSFSPNGRRIAYRRTHTIFPCKPSRARGGAALHSIHPNGRGDRRLSPIESKEREAPIYSPDGRRIVFRRGRSLRTMPADGGRMRLVTGSAGISGILPVAWAVGSERRVAPSQPGSLRTPAAAASVPIVPRCSGRPPGCAPAARLLQSPQ